MISKEVQLVLDESYYNDLLKGYFGQLGEVSLLEFFRFQLTKATGGNFPMFENLMTTSAVGYYFPEIKRMFGEGKKVDIKCDFSKGDKNGRMEGLAETGIMIRSGN